MAVDTPKMSNQRESKVDSHGALQGLASHVLHPPFHCVLFVWGDSLSPPNLKGVGAKESLDPFETTTCKWLERNRGGPWVTILVHLKTWNGLICRKMICSVGTQDTINFYWPISI